MRLLALLLLWTWAGYLVLREQVLGLRFWWDRGFLDWTQNPLVRSAGADRWLMPAALLGRYAVLLVAPHRLSPDYGALAIGWHTSLQDPYLLAGLTVAGISLAALVIALIRGNRAFAFALIGLGLSYGMVSNLPAIIGTNFAERLMYMPSAFFLLIVGLAFARFRAAWLIPVLVLGTTAWGMQSARYARLWSEPVALLEQSIENQPGAIRLYVLLAEEQARRGELEASSQSMARARRLIPDYAYVWYRSALMAADRGDFEAARSHLAEAMRLDPAVVPPGVSKAIRQGRSPLAESPKR
jgi:tetratricopeptide (TPR) repeat protein